MVVITHLQSFLCVCVCHPSLHFNAIKYHLFKMIKVMKFNLNKQIYKALSILMLLNSLEKNNLILYMSKLRKKEKKRTLAKAKFLIRK